MCISPKDNFLILFLSNFVRILIDLSICSCFMYVYSQKHEFAALMLAAEGGHTETVKVLIAAGANVNVIVSVQCSLHFEPIFYFYRCSFSLRM